uniref:Uncharacterized protein n=1 Tax=Nelumbo nucifera TaxID=4432 RepID=A0A822Y6V8_NELNU|nr:TPA_asm: hypothetical protein HUJ06_029665 [Nelumbo nucifera]
MCSASLSFLNHLPPEVQPCLDSSELLDELGLKAAEHVQTYQRRISRSS